MSVLLNPPKYFGRSVQDWLRMARRGDILLPNFQRSYVWDSKRVAAYLMALLENKPTGIFLILKSAASPQFKSRPLHNTGVEGNQPRELVLDGQQRLTSLWAALGGSGDKRYFIRVKSLVNLDMTVEEVIYRSPSWKRNNAEAIWREDCVPADILWNGGKPSNAPHTIGAWCKKAVEGEEEWQALYDATSDLRNRLLQRRLQYCVLDSTTDPDTAIDIFVKVNESAVTLKPVDIAIALAQAHHNADLRLRAEAFLDRSTEARYYFSPWPQRAITEVAEWALKVGCLKISSEEHPNGLPPKASHYPSAVSSMFRGSTDEWTERMNQFEADLDAALRFAACRGGATKKTLPAWPPVHVIAALQDDVRATGALSGEAERLLSAYMWRAFFTDRYQLQANDRLWEDFRALRNCLQVLAQGGTLEPSALVGVPVFSDGYPLPKAGELARGIPWIGGASRLGRAVAALVMQGNPLDWVTGEKLDPTRLRELEDSGKLLRYQVFPAQFEDSLGSKLKHGLNGVLLAKGPMPPANQRDPHAFLKWIGARSGISKFAVYQRVHSHLANYPESAGTGGSLKWRFDNFLAERAAKVHGELKKLTSL